LEDSYFMIYGKNMIEEQDNIKDLIQATSEERTTSIEESVRETIA